jgi:4-hydroxy-tetrahydrodipicolinate synthase
MTSNPFKGLGTALVTPFDIDGRVDLQKVAELAHRQIDGSVDMLVPCGTTGEAVTLDDDEYSAVIGTVVDAAAKRVPVLAGAGSNSTSRTIDTAKRALEAGADGVLLVGPYYNKPTQDGYFEHYRTIAEALNAPIVIYNVPGRTSGNMTAETQLRIAAIDNVVGTKEASGDLSQLMHIVYGRPEGFSVLSGDDNLAFAQISTGADGVISVISNELPGDVAALVHAALAGDLATARAQQRRLLDLMEVNFIESSPIPVKTAMAMMGLIEERFRLPLVPMQSRTRIVLRDTLRALGLETSE